MSFENTVDQIYALLDKVTVKQALEALTAAIMGTTEKCHDPNLALLGVIAELSDLARFRDTLGIQFKPDKALSLIDWIKETRREG
jgi:hypothetical protein